MKRRFGSRNTVRASTATLALVAAFAACVTDEPSIVFCGEPTKLWCPPRTVCAMEGNRCDPEGCGDGIVDRLNGEVCDPANPEHGDLCSADCRMLESCGNTIVDPGEVCDPTAPDSMGPCGMDCQPLAACGDGEVTLGEACDEGIGGTRRATPTCNDDCTVPWCGDGTENPSFVNPATGRPEECDERENTENCDADCTLPKCGDGLFNEFFVIDPETGLKEVCDEGEDAPNCDADCTLPECGDLHVNNTAGEECDEGMKGMPAAPEDSITCDSDCTRRVCGDGHVNEAAAADNSVTAEACDDGSDSATCNGPSAGLIACQPARCGDEYVNKAAGEACDDGEGNDPTADACPSGPQGSCQPARCGDGFRRLGLPSEHPEGEDCDDGGDSLMCNGPAAGTVACRLSACGDGYRNQVDGEFCDDGNDFDFDDCPSDTSSDEERVRCRPARCGDGFHRFGLELCDPGFGQDPAGPPIDAEDCDSDCTFVVCGDRHVNTAAGEQCDDGGESAACNGPNAGDDACKPSSCGDGYVNELAGEECERDEDCGTGGGCRLEPDDAMRCDCL